MSKAKSDRLLANVAPDLVNRLLRDAEYQAALLLWHAACQEKEHLSLPRLEMFGQLVKIVTLADFLENVAPRRKAVFQFAL